VKEKPYRTLDELIEAVKDKSIAEIVAARRPGRRLFSVDDLRAAGVLDVRPASRKSLSAGVKRDQLPLFGDDDMEPTNEHPTPRKSDEEDSEEELP
jgi:hypothetical protein